jgi:hypothetical protein
MRSCADAMFDDATSDEPITAIEIAETVLLVIQVTPTDSGF